MDLLEGVALLSFVAMLGWIVVEIAWREEPGAARETADDAVAAERHTAPAVPPANGEGGAQRDRAA